MSKRVKISVLDNRISDKFIRAMKSQTLIKDYINDQCNLMAKQTEEKDFNEKNHLKYVFDVSPLNRALLKPILSFNLKSSS